MNNIEDRKVFACAKRQLRNLKSSTDKCNIVCLRKRRGGRMSIIPKNFSKHAKSPIIKKV